MQVNDFNTWTVAHTFRGHQVSHLILNLTCQVPEKFYSKYHKIYMWHTRKIIFLLQTVTNWLEQLHLEKTPHPTLTSEVFMICFSQPQHKLTCSSKVLPTSHICLQCRVLRYGNVMQDLWFSHCSEHVVLLGYDTVSMGKCFLTFWRNAAPSSSKVKMFQKKHPFFLPDKGWTWKVLLYTETSGNICIKHRVTSQEIWILITLQDYLDWVNKEYAVTK